MNQHPTTWAYDQEVRGFTKFVLCTLADYAGMKNKPPFPSYETLAAKCGISRSSVIRALSELEKAKLVTKEKRFNKSNIYHLNMGSHSDTGESHVDTTEVPHRDSGGITQTPKPTINHSTTNQLTKEEEWGVKETKAKKVELPEVLNTSAFEAAWSSYLQYLGEIKKPPLAPSTVKEKWAEMAKWGHDTAIEAIRQTIGNGWKNIFPPKSIPSKPRAEGAPQPKESSAQKPRSTWDIKQQIEAIDDRLSELRKHRGECAGGDYVWDSPTFKDQYRALFSKRKQLNAQLINQ